MSYSHKDPLFHAINRKAKNTLFASICRREDINIPLSTGRQWIKQRKQYGTPIAIRRTRKLSARLGKPPRIDSPALTALLDREYPDHYLSNDQLSQKFDLHPITVQQNLSKRLNACRYRKSHMKAISRTNKDTRIEYRSQYKGKTFRKIPGFTYTSRIRFISSPLTSVIDLSMSFVSLPSVASQKPALTVCSIVAVPGLSRHRDKTWTAANGMHWLHYLLPTDIPNARFLLGIRCEHAWRLRPLPIPLRPCKATGVGSVPQEKAY